MALCAAFTKATGVNVKVINESLDDVQPKASVAANTNQGPDMFWGLYSLPHLFPAKCVDVTDVAGYLGKKYGGWVSTAETYGKGPGGKWIAIPVAYNGNVINYRQSMIEKAGFKEVPKDTAGFLDLMKGLKEKSVPGGFALGRASGDGNAWVHWALWSQGANLVDAKDKVIINSPETVKALEYCKALSDTFVAGTASWNDAFNNKAFLESQVSLTNNGVSIYAAAKAAAAKGDAKAKEVMDDMNHSLWPIGPAGKPTEFHIAYPLMIMKYSKVPNACKAFMSFMLEAENYDKWLQEAVAYLTHPLNAYWNNLPARAGGRAGWASPTPRSAARAVGRARELRMYLLGDAVHGWRCSTRCSTRRGQRAEVRLGLWLALLLNEKLPFKTFFRASCCCPSSCPPCCRRSPSGGSTIRSSRSSPGR
jgi:multiple sugar transport system substrate-binding protein